MYRDKIVEEYLYFIAVKKLDWKNKGVYFLSTSEWYGNKQERI